MSRKYQAGQDVDVFEVRSELYGLWNLIQTWKNNHLFDVSKRLGPHDQKGCLVCLERDAGMRAITMAIRAFGGSPRR